MLSKFTLPQHMEAQAFWKYKEAMNTLRALWENHHQELDDAEGMEYASYERRIEAVSGGPWRCLRFGRWRGVPIKRCR